MWIATFFVLIASANFNETAQTLYGAGDRAGLERLCASVTQQEEDFLCRYRLYPLTENRALLNNLPADLPAHASARSLALLAGLWGYKASTAPITRMPAYGGRSLRLMERARALDPDEPFLLLVDGQSLLFRPAIAGGNRRHALERFTRLHAVAQRRTGTGVSVNEAEIWRWYALHRLNDASAPALRERLLRQNLPSLYHAFLNEPPAL